MGGKAYESNECRILFSHSCYFQSHKKTHRRVAPYVCNDCGKGFSYSSSLKIHQTVHTGSRPFEYAECGKSFGRRSHFVQHQRVHTGAKPYECNEYGKAFNCKDTLSTRKFTMEKALICAAVVGEPMSIKMYLLSTRKIHTREKSECGECGKLFGHSACIKIHKRSHSGTRPYVCGECEKAYISNPHLNQHKKVHTSVKPVDEVNVGNLLMNPASFYTRDFTLEQFSKCGRAYRRPSHLAWHMKVHTEEKPHECSSFVVPLPAFIKFV
ncbi:zinc finger protein 304-like [Kogia breviceps]|uniref:zinc finger protein 304-like n=1 Tax=Kogia breviceps TaxID=27615 RepID=UPI0034D340D9